MQFRCQTEPEGSQLGAVPIASQGREKSADLKSASTARSFRKIARNESQINLRLIHPDASVVLAPRYWHPEISGATVAALHPVRLQADAGSRTQLLPILIALLR